MSQDITPIITPELSPAELGKLAKSVINPLLAVADKKTLKDDEPKKAVIKPFDANSVGKGEYEAGAGFGGRVQQVSRNEFLTVDGAEIIRVFYCYNYEDHKEICEALLGGVDQDVRVRPAQDTYYTNFYCSKVEVCSTDDAGFTFSPGISPPTDKKQIIKELPEGGALITAHYVPILSAGIQATSVSTGQQAQPDELLFDLVDYQEEYFTIPIAIPRGAIVDLNSFTSIRPSADTDNTTYPVPYKKIRFTRKNVPMKFADDLLPLAAKLQGKVNYTAFDPLMGIGQKWDAETVRFDGIQPIYKVFYNDGANRMVDLVYNYTINLNYGEYVEPDGSLKTGFRGWNRSLQKPGHQTVNGKYNYWDINWYRIGYRKDFFLSGFIGEQLLKQETKILPFYELKNFDVLNTKIKESKKAKKLKAGPAI